MMKYLMFAVLSVASFSAFAQEGTIPHNAELIFTNALTLTEMTLLKFVYPEDRKKIRETFEHGISGAAMVCSDLAVIEDNYWAMITRAVTEVDWSNSNDVTLYNTMKTDMVEHKQMINAFCGFANDGSLNVPTGVPSSAMTVLLVKHRNHLRWGSTQTFSKPDSSRPQIHYWTQNSINLVDFIKKKYLYDSNGGFQSINHSFVWPLQLSYYLGRLATSAAIVVVAKRYLYEDRKPGNTAWCDAATLDLQSHSQEIRDTFCYRHPHDRGVTPFTINQGLVDTLDDFKSKMSNVRTHCMLD